MKLIDLTTSSLLLIFPKISRKFPEISGNIKFPENLQHMSPKSQWNGTTVADCVRHCPKQRVFNAV